MISLNEERVLETLKKNPYLSQQEIADLLNLPRSTVATLISNLTSKNLIKGRAYVVSEEPGIICIGGMNVDRKYVIQGDVVMGTSNPVDSNFSIGGVGRNVAENLGRLDENVSFLSVAGYDHDFEWIKDQTETYVNMANITQIQGESTGSYSAILDQSGEMQLALADMSIYDKMDVNWISQHDSLLASAKMIVSDLNVPKDTIDYLIQFAKKKDIPLTLIPVSSPKMARLPQRLEGVDTLIVNLDESESFLNYPAKTSQDKELLLDRWMETGLEQVILTSGKDPALYANQAGDRQAFDIPAVDQVVDVTGAGDSFASGFIFGQVQGFDFEKSMQLAMTNSYHTIQSPYTVRLNLSNSNLMKEKNKLFS